MPIIVALNRSVIIMAQIAVVYLSGSSNVDFIYYVIVTSLHLKTIN